MLSSSIKDQTIYGKYKSALNDELNKLSDTLNKINQDDDFYKNIINKTSFYIEQNASEVAKIISSLKNDPDKEILINILISLFDEMNIVARMKHNFEEKTKETIGLFTRTKKKAKNSEPTSESLAKQILTQHSTGKSSNLLYNSSISQVTKKKSKELLSAYIIDFEEKSNIHDLIIDFNENLIETLPTHEQFEWPRDTNTDLELNETEATPHMISHLQNYITNESYEFKDVSTDPDFQLSIHLEKTTFNGRPDAIIVPKGCFATPYQTRVAFEFKTNKSISKSSEQIKFESIACNLASCHPVLTVQTDLKRFYLLVYHDRKIVQLCLENAKKALEYINYWLKNKCDPSDFFSFTTVDEKHQIYPYAHILTYLRKRDMHFKNLQDFLGGFAQVDWYCVDKTNYLTDEEKQKAKKIMNAFKKGHEELKISGRSGKCYKIELDNKYYALKIHTITPDHPDILTEMQIEKTIYSHLKKKTDGKWPQIYFGGFMFNGKAYAICTNYIEGDCYTQQKFTQLDHKLKKKFKDFCSDTIKELHQLKIAHLDVRAPNFIFTNDAAFIIDFGFAVITENSNEYFKSDLNLLDGLFKTKN